MHIFPPKKPAKMPLRSPRSPYKISKYTLLLPILSLFFTSFTHISQDHLNSLIYSYFKPTVPSHFMFHVLRSPKLWLRSPLEMQFSLIVFAFQCTIHFGFSWQGHFKHFVACFVRKCNNLCHIQCFYQLRSPKIWLRSLLEMSLA